MKMSHLAATCAFASGAFGMATAAAAEKLILGSYLPPAHVQSVHGAEAFMSCVNTASGGAIEFDYFPSGQIVSAGATFSAIQEGLLQIGMLATAFASDSFPLNQVTVLPGLSERSADSVTAYRKVLTEGGLIADELAANGIVALGSTYLPAYQVAVRTGGITTAEGMAGLKLRAAAGSQVFAAEEVGATPVQMSPADAYLAMQQGTVDGVLFPFASLNSYKMQDTIKAVSNNVSFGNAQTLFAMDRDTFEGMSKEHQDILTTCGAETEANLAEVLDENEAKLAAEFAAQGIEVFAFGDAEKEKIQTALGNAAGSYIARIEQLGHPAQAAYDQFKKALDQ